MVAAEVWSRGFIVSFHWKFHLWQHITRDEVASEVEPFIGTDISDIAWLALFLLAERRRGQDSEWAPYISGLPCVHDMHCSIFWSNDELEMIRPSHAYEEALHQRICIESDFFAIKPALEHFPEIFGDISFEDFIHAYSLVQVIADRNYAAGEEVLIRYGKFPNATLLLDFGFTLPNNIHEQVQISMGVPVDDPLHITKMELLQRHCMPTVENISTLSSSRGSFTIKEVRSLHRKGKGIPQALRAFVRVLSATSLEELKELCSEASENDGRLARRPLRSRSREIEAHCILISHIKLTIQEYNASIELLDSRDTPSNATQHPCRRQMARDLLTGELRVLKSACSWLTNYCSC